MTEWAGDETSQYACFQRLLMGGRLKAGSERSRMTSDKTYITPSFSVCACERDRERRREGDLAENDTHRDDLESLFLRHLSHPEWGEESRQGEAEEHIDNLHKHTNNPTPQLHTSVMADAAFPTPPAFRRQNLRGYDISPFSH